MKCVIISGGKIDDCQTVRSNVLSAQFVICADSGIAYADALGITADVWVGDFDSATPGRHRYRELIQLPTEKDDTDTMQAARIAVERGAADVCLIGCSGTRLDHTYANLFVLRYLQQNGITARMIDRHNTAFIMSGTQRVSRENGTNNLSVLPFCCTASGVTLRGVKYPLTDATLTDSFPIGVSNEITSEFADITVESGCVVVYISRD